MASEIVVSVDPGLHGACCVMTNHGILVSVFNLPVAKDGAKQWIDGGRFHTALKDALSAPMGLPGLTAEAFVEQVHAMPGQGVRSMATFGRAEGSSLAVLEVLGLPLRFVTPSKWKAHFGLHGKDKAGSLAKARLLYPHEPYFSRKCDADRAEAVLIARYALEKLCLPIPWHEHTAHTDLTHTNTEPTAS